MDLENLAAEFDRAAERHPGYVTVFDFGEGKRSEGGGIHFGGIDKAAMLDLATLWRKAQPHLPEARVNPQTHDDGALDWLAARGRWDAELNYAEQREVNPFREIATCLRLEVKDNGKPPAEEDADTSFSDIRKLHPERFPNDAKLRRFLDNNPGIPRRTTGRRSYANLAAVGKAVLAESGPAAITDQRLDTYMEGVEKRKAEIAAKKSSRN